MFNRLRQAGRRFLTSLRTRAAGLSPRQGRNPINSPNAKPPGRSNARAAATSGSTTA